MALNAIEPAVPGQVISAAYFNEQAPEQISAIANGSAVLAKLTLDGEVIDPPVSAVDTAVISYNSVDDEIRVSKNAGPFEPLGSSSNNANAVFATRFFG